MFATSPGAYLTALAGSVAVLAVAVVWVLKSDEAFHEAADEAARRRGRQAQGQRTVSYRARTAGWTLAPSGRPEGAFAWKAAMQTLRVVDKRGSGADRRRPLRLDDRRHVGADARGRPRRSAPSPASPRSSRS